MTTPTRRSPMCKTCNTPMKGHKDRQCIANDARLARHGAPMTPSPSPDRRFFSPAPPPATHENPSREEIEALYGPLHGNGKEFVREGSIETITTTPVDPNTGEETYKDSRRYNYNYDEVDERWLANEKKKEKEAEEKYKQTHGLFRQESSFITFLKQKAPVQANIFSFPADAVPELEEKAKAKGYHVAAFPTHKAGEVRFEDAEDRTFIIGKDWKAVRRAERTMGPAKDNTVIAPPATGFAASVPAVLVAQVEKPSTSITYTAAFMVAIVSAFMLFLLLANAPE